jgi:phospholipase/lecithinase/hemolysin
MFRFAASSMPVTLRRLGLVTLACSAVLLSACGGGDRAKAYVPDRVVSFGDENSMIDTYTTGIKDATNGQGTLKGLVYTVNTIAYVTIASTGYLASPVCADVASPNFQKCTTDNGATSFTAASTDNVVFDASSANFLTTIEHQTSPAYQRTTDTAYSCTGSTIWIQVIAHNFSRGYQGASGQCPTDSYGGAVTYASYQAKVADVANQVAAHKGELGSGVLVTVMVGQHDILEQYALVQAGSLTQASAVAELKNRAATMANVVRDLMATGAKVVLALTPDLGESPKAIASGENQALLSTLTKTFNEALYITELGSTSGRKLAGVNPEPYTNTSTRSTSYVYRTAVCDPAKAFLPGYLNTTLQSDASLKVKFCTTASLVTDGSVSTYMWADDTHFAPLGHSLIGVAAYNRAYNQF